MVASGCTLWISRGRSWCQIHLPHRHTPTDSVRIRLWPLTNRIEIILFRGLSGIAASFCLPSAVSIITSSFTGRYRDMAFAFMGGGQPAGFILGLVVGGVLTDAASWRVGFYASSAVTAITFVLILWGLPSSPEDAIDMEADVAADRPRYRLDRRCHIQHFLRDNVLCSCVCIVEIVA